MLCKLAKYNRPSRKYVGNKWHPRNNLFKPQEASTNFINKFYKADQPKKKNKCSLRDFMKPFIILRRAWNVKARFLFSILVFLLCNIHQGFAKVRLSTEIFPSALFLIIIMESKEIYVFSLKGVRVTLSFYER